MNSIAGLPEATSYGGGSEKGSIEKTAESIQ